MIFYNRTIRKGFILCPYLCNLYAEHIIQKCGLDSEEGGVIIGGRNNAGDATILSESGDELKQFLMKEESAGLVQTSIK